MDKKMRSFCCCCLQGRQPQHSFVPDRTNPVLAELHNQALNQFLPKPAFVDFFIEFNF